MRLPRYGRHRRMERKSGDYGMVPCPGNAVVNAQCGWRHSKPPAVDRFSRQPPIAVVAGCRRQHAVRRCDGHIERMCATSDTKTCPDLRRTMAIYFDCSMGGGRTLAVPHRALGIGGRSTVGHQPPALERELERKHIGMSM